MINCTSILFVISFGLISCSTDTPMDQITDNEMSQDSIDMEPEIDPVAHIALIAQFPSGINECSGMIKIDDKILSMNDGSNHTLLQQINPNTAEILSTISINQIANNDWEALQYSDGNIYIADTGNNEGDRENLSLYTIPYDSGSELTCTDTINFIWPDQISFESSFAHPFDCESLLIDDETAIFFSKNRSDLKTNVYRMNLSTEEIVKGESISIGGLSTDAVFDPSGDVILLSYLTLNGSSFINKINILETVDETFQLKESIGIDPNTQIEAIVHLEDHKYLLGAESESSEGGYLYSLDLGEYYE